MLWSGQTRLTLQYDYAMVLYYCKIVSGYKAVMLNERICDDNKIRKIKKTPKKQKTLQYDRTLSLNIEYVVALKRAFFGVKMFRSGNRVDPTSF